MIGPLARMLLHRPQMGTRADQRGPLKDDVERMMERLSNRKWRELLGRHIFGLKEAE